MYDTFSRTVVVHVFSTWNVMMVLSVYSPRPRLLTTTDPLPLTSPLAVVRSVITVRR